MRNIILILLYFFSSWKAGVSQICTPYFETPINTVVGSNRVFPIIDLNTAIGVSSFNLQGEFIFFKTIPSKILYYDNEIISNVNWDDDFRQSIKVMGFPTRNSGLVLLMTMYGNNFEYCIVEMDSTGEFKIHYTDLATECKIFRSHDEFEIYLLNFLVKLSSNYSLDVYTIREEWAMQRGVRANSGIPRDVPSGKAYTLSTRPMLLIGNDSFKESYYIADLKKTWKINLNQMKLARFRGYFPIPFKNEGKEEDSKLQVGYLTVLDFSKCKCCSYGNDYVTHLIKFEVLTGKILWKRKCFPLYSD